MRIYLIRHGMTTANERRLYCGSSDLPLSTEGVRQLKKIRYDATDAQRFITSGMLRCDETMTLLFGEVDREAISGFREIDFGAFELKSYDTLKNDPAYQAWISGDNERNVPPGGESGEHMARRVLCSFGEVLSDGRNAVIVTHGGTIAVIMAALFPKEGRSRYDWQPKPGHGYVLDMNEDSVNYRELEDAAMSNDWRTKKPEECNYSFTQHRSCEFFTCHKTDDPDNFNCLFCYCPLYTLGSKCGGNFVYLENGHKDCSNCLVPHRRGSYSYIISKYPELAELAKKNR